MNQLKFYKYGSLALLLLNIAMLSFFILTKPRPRPPHNPPPNAFQNQIIEILGLDNQQETTFKTLARDHNDKMISLNENQQKLLLPYFQSLADSSLNIDEEIVLSQFQQLEREKMEVTHEHLNEIRNLLSEDQLPSFEKFMSVFTDRILRSGNNNRPPPQEFE